jgi:muramoyltetrapeptide carboxypeptidase
MNNFIKPPLLHDGDKVAIIAPSGRVEQDYIERSKRIFEQWGLTVIPGPNLFARQHQFAGSDTQRLSDLQWALDDDEIAAVFCARGGYGLMRIIDQVHWHKFIQKPKWVTGFSDVTALHAQISSRMVQSIHSLMPINMASLSVTDKPVELLRNVLFKGEFQYSIEPNSLNRTGTEKAILIGGNLSILYALSGTEVDPDTENKILFIEDVGEQYYHIDRMMQSLRLSGKLEKLSGLIVGGLSEMTDNKRPFGRNPEEIISDIVAGFDFPVAFGFPAGHISQNYPFIMGAEVAMEVGTNEVKISM